MGIDTKPSDSEELYYHQEVESFIVVMSWNFYPTCLISPSDTLGLDQGVAQCFGQTFVNSLTSRMISCGRSRLRKCPPFLITSSLAPGIRSNVARRSDSRDQS